MFEAMPYDEEKYQRAKKHWDELAKPLQGMGLFEELISRIEGMPNAGGLKKRCVLVFCADNGVAEEGVTQTGSEVTATVAENMARGDATVCIMAKAAGADVFPVDIGMCRAAEGVRDEHILRGTHNFYQTRAMSREECLRAVKKGASLAREFAQKGYGVIAAGEMGIGNTTTAGAVASVLLDLPPRLVTGKGAGLSPAGLERKIQIIERSVARLQPDREDALDVLSKVGGLDIAGMCGAFLGGAQAGIPVIIDGVISAVAALCAAKLCPQSKKYMIASHLSGEPAAKYVLDSLGFAAPIRADMALGEGTGAVALLPLLDMAYAVFREMICFSQTDIEEYKPL